VFRSSRIALAGLFVALAPAIDLLTAPIPNVELMSLVIFLGGAATGGLTGCFIGLAAEVIHSLLNPLGPAFPLVFSAQLLGMGLVGWTGGRLGPQVAGLGRAAALAALAGLGFILTAVFDVLTNLALGIHLGPVWPTLIGGIPFAIAHIVSNTVVYAGLGLGGLRVLRELGLVEACGGGSGPRCAGG
jgi:hypothetical protein